MNLKFKCPECGCERMESIEENCTVSSEITNIEENGDFDYELNPCVDGDDGVARFCCLKCNFVLKDENNNIITDNEKAAKWCAKNCPQN